MHRNMLHDLPMRNFQPATFTTGKDRALRLLFIQPGKPAQNAWIERFNRTVRHEWQDERLIESIDFAQQTATDWISRYNYDRPNMATGGIPPKQKLALAP